MRKYLFLLGGAVCIASAVSAQEADELVLASEAYANVPEGQITVTATGTRTEVEDTGQAVTIITRPEIEAIQGADLTRVLERAPGVTITRNGGIGGFTGVRVRGAEAEQLLVLIDGVRVADPASPSGGFDFGNLLTGNVDKLDLLRGSNSTIWGSDAVGGVLLVTTAPITSLAASAEYGARDTAFATLSGDVVNDAGALGLSGSYFRTDGFSAADAGTEADGFEQYSIAGRARAYLTDNFNLFARGRYAEGDLELDGFPAPTFALADTDEFQETRQYSVATGASYDSALLDVTATYSFADTERANFNPAFGTQPGFVSDGHSDRIDVRGEWRPLGPLIVNFGGEHEWSNFETNFTSRQDTRIFGAYAQFGVEFGPLSAHLGARHDDHERFGGATSFGGDLSYAVAPDIRLRASVGEGFKAPSLFQLFSDFGNEALQPERSTSYDLGLAWRDRSAPSYASITAFRRDASDQILFVSCFGLTDDICTDRPFGTYDNVGRVRAQGFEVELGASPSETIGVRAAYAFVDTENRTPGAANEGNALARRPEHALTFSADWQVWERGLTLGGDIRLVGDSFDDAGNFVPLDGYAVGTVRASVPLGERVEIFGRVENVTDADYQTAAGYGTPGRGGFVGARAKF